MSSRETEKKSVPRLVNGVKRPATAVGKLVNGVNRAVDGSDDRGNPRLARVRGSERREEALFSPFSPVKGRGRLIPGIRGSRMPSRGCLSGWGRRLRLLLRVVNRRERADR